MSYRIVAVLCVALCALTLAACGGGGKKPSEPQPQTITFATSGTVSGAVGATVTNVASGGSGTGEITYSSSNLSVATVNPISGVATLLSVGTATITATKAASNGYSQATATYTLNVTPATQTISFAQGGPLQTLVGVLTNNAASGGEGSGAVTYATSNAAVATVNATTGAVTAVGTGTATITATKAADTNYQQAQATYSINVVDSVSVNAWVGAADTQVTLSAAANGLRFTRAGDRNCNLANYAVCTRGQQTIVANAPGTPIVDTAVTTSDAGYYWLQTNTVNSVSTPVNINRFSERMGHGALYFNGRYWVIGGARDVVANAKADVWSSVDGRTWELETDAAPFGARWLHQAVVYDNKMWVIGGFGPPGVSLNNVWSSADGATWTQVAASLPFASLGNRVRIAVFNNGSGNAMWAIASGNVYRSTDGVIWTQQVTNFPVGGTSFRAYATLTAFSGKLWYIGGTPNFSSAVADPTIDSVNEVWSSPDGVTWTLEPAPPFADRMQHTSFVLNGRLWVFGGRRVIDGMPQDPVADAYSTDGVTWRAEALNTEIDQSYLGQVIQESNRVTLVGGILRGWSAKVHQSTDGNNWNELSAFAQFSPRLAARAVSFLGDLWIVGGATLNEIDTNDIWRSSDGVNWSRVTPTTAIFSARDNHEVLVFNNRLWVIGGWGNSVNIGGDGVRLNDVWSSADGVSWRQETASAGFSPRLNFATAIFNAGSGSRMWVVGGETATDTFSNDVWSSSDGINWTQETSSANFTARGGHSVVTFNNELWLIAGANIGFVDVIVAGAFTNEIWRSSNGVTWTPVAAGPRFTARFLQEAIVYNNRIWVIAGSDSVGTINDVWWSADGVTWHQATAAASFSRRTGFSSLVHNNEMWVIAGYASDRFNDVWRSADGVNWRVAIRGAIRMP